MSNAALCANVKTVDNIHDVGSGYSVDKSTCNPKSKYMHLNNKYVIFIYTMHFLHFSQIQQTININNT